MISKICPTCKDTFVKKYSYSRLYWKRQKYCSIRCSGTLIKKGSKPWNKDKRFKKYWGKGSPSYKGGRNISVAGYVRILIPGTGKYQLEHRLVMEKHLGRKLDRQEIVHHRNGNREDNRLENLELMEKIKHDSYETKRRWNNKTMPFRKNLNRGGL